MHFIALPFKRDLKTLRDLTGEHLPLLKSIRDDGYKLILSRYGLPQSKVKAFFHYYPTFYHLHVHFTYVDMIESVGAFSGKAIFLEDVIDNIEI